jgi:hypothetical protein
MDLGLAVAALCLSVVALSIAVGVSLGRDGDRRDHQVYRDQVAGAMNEFDERLGHVEDMADPLRKVKPRNET